MYRICSFIQLNRVNSVKKYKPKRGVDAYCHNEVHPSIMRRIAALSLSLLSILTVTGFHSAIATASVVAEDPVTTLRSRVSPSEKYKITRNAAVGPLLSGKVNEVCTLAQISGVTFDGIRKFQSYVNFCELPVSAMPLDVRTLVEKAGAIHAKVAQLLGQDLATTFRLPIEIFVNADARGSMGTRATGGGIELSALPDWSVADFPSEIYAHELMHILTFNPGPTASALLGLQEHPFLIEALPDLISATIHDAPKLSAGEKSLPACLINVRDGTPVRSLGQSFRRYYPLESYDTVNDCCATLNLALESPFAQSICQRYQFAKPAKLESTEIFIKNNALVTTPYSEANLSAPFDASQCRVTTRTGLVFLDNCSTHSFGVPLVSFFFRLKELIGTQQVTAFFSKVRDYGVRTSIYECGFTKGTAEKGGVKAYVALRPLLAPLMAYRTSLTSADQAHFDRAWQEHEFGKLIDLDRLYRNEALAGAAQVAVKSKNSIFRDDFSCENPYDFDPAACGVTCTQKL